MLISEETISIIRKVLCDRFGFDSSSLNFEIQDDFQFLLISVVGIYTKGEKMPVSLKDVAMYLNETMPQRQGDYTWMVTLGWGDEVAESYFGGDSDSPDSGL
ncbi:hypothetical protein [Andreprevotia chitinilytica]|uniref:hypothetical protein n=1 Tax=Andreprevotia chitinilytica TaxID=396808 RepID=UPI0012EB613B|nr:hypothetical protein [Andreprevotia chitinilytica]